MVFYGFTGVAISSSENNESRTQAAFEAIAELGPVPVIVGGDFNIDPEDSPALWSVLSTGLFFDVLRWQAHASGDEPDGACLVSGNRLDCFVCNREAFAALLGKGASKPSVCSPHIVPFLLI